METTPFALVRSLFDQLGWPSVKTFPSTLPRDGKVSLPLNDALTLSADCYAGETELQMALLRRPGVAVSERWVASATQSAAGNHVFLEKSVYEGVELTAHVTSTIPLQELAGNSVAEKMAYGAMLAADLEGEGHPKLGWKSGAFKPLQRTPGGASPGRLACWVCLLGLCTLLAVAGYQLSQRRPSQEA